MQQLRNNEQNIRKGKGKRILGIAVPVVIFLAGIALLLYPTFSNWWNDRFQSRAIATYDDIVAENDDVAIEEMLAAAEVYNESLREARAENRMTIADLTDEQMEEYNSVLDVTGTGIMGYVKIPKIDVELPIYHGTDESVLQIAIGHIEGTSLPIGGKGTHAAISGHRGLPSATLFTDIDSLGEGDVFMITCLGRKVTYQVDQITTVLPTELQDLEIDPEQDYCTLVTCTPYGINSHRLLVRGHRIDNLIDDDVRTIQVDIPERELSQQERIQQYLPYILILAAGFFALALIIPSKKRDESTASGETGKGRRHKKRLRKDGDNPASAVEASDKPDQESRMMNQEVHDAAGSELHDHTDAGHLSEGSPMQHGDDDVEFYDTVNEVYTGEDET